MQTAIAGVIGKEIGKQDVAKAKEYNRVTIHLSLVITLVNIACYYIFKEEIFSFLTNVESIKKICLDMIVLFCIFQFFDMAQGFLQGQIKALGQQNRMIKICIFVYWFIQLPMAWILGVKFGHKVQGFYYSTTFC